MPKPNLFQLAALHFLLILAACGGQPDDLDVGQDARIDARQDARIDAAVDARVQPQIGKIHELELLPPIDPDHPFNHSTEPSVAAHGDDVVVFYINLALDSSDTFHWYLHHRRVAVATSHDGGDTFSQAIDPGLGDKTSDPVVRVNADGVFFASLVDPQPDIVLGRSDDGGETWMQLARVPGYDKEWIALSNEQGRLYLGATAGSWVFDWSGRQLGFCQSDLCCNLHNGGYADKNGVHFAVGGGKAIPLQVVFWDGVSDAVQEGNDLTMGLDDAWNNVAVSLGTTRQQRQWIVRAVETSGGGHRVVVRLRNLPEDEGVDQPISASGRHGFLPAATTDDQGRLYVAWYETGPDATGVLKLTKSLDSDYSNGFGQPIVIDDAACPGRDWFPSSDNPDTNDRRLREYIDIAVTNSRAHIVWTHAPRPPARVRTVAVQFPD